MAFFACEIGRHVSPLRANLARFVPAPIALSKRKVKSPADAAVAAVAADAAVAAVAAVATATATGAVARLKTQSPRSAMACHQQKSPRAIVAHRVPSIFIWQWRPAQR